MINKIRLTDIILPFLRSIILLIVLIPISKLQAQEDAAPILVISSYNPDTRNTVANITEFMEEYNALGGKSPITVRNMNCESLPEATMWKDRLGRILADFGGDKRPELVILLGQEAWSSYISQDNLPYKDVPVLIGMASQNAIFLPDSSENVRTWEPRYFDLQSYKEEGFIVSGYAYNYDVLKNVDLIRSLYPETKHIALLTDNTYGGVALQTYVKKEMEKIPGLNLIFLDGRKGDIYNIVEQIKELPENSAILIGTWRVDVNDGYQVGNATYTMMIARPEIPAFSISSTGIGHWAIGGYTPIYRSVGKDLAHQALSILNKEIPRDEITAETIPNGYMFDAQKLKELNIDRSTLPKNSTFVNDDENFFDKYRYEILLSVIIFLVGFLIMVFVFFIRTKRLKDRLMDLQEDNTLIMNNMQSSIKYIKPDFTVKWENNINYDCIPQYGPDNCFLRKEPILPYCDNCSVIRAMETKKTVDIIKDCDAWGRYLHVVCTPVLDEKENLLGVVFKKDDVTKQKKGENELREAKEKAEESDKLKSAFLANMSHEIRTPLNAIVGFSSLLSVTEDPEEKVEYMNIINNNNDLLLQLINDILDIAKIEAGTLDFVDSDVDVNALFHEIEQSMRLKIKQPNVTLKFDSKSPHLLLFTDKNRLAQVITNFINNAIKFTEEGSIIFGYNPLDDGQLYFYVTDTGCGMSEEGTREVFQRFIKLNSFVQGTGLGLSICETIIKKLNGEIGVDSVLGKGSTFWFKLPPSLIITQSDEAHSVEKSTNKEDVVKIDEEDDNGNIIKAPHPNMMILVGEEYPVNYMQIQKMVDGFEMMHAASGEEVFAMYSAYLPKIIFVDADLDKEEFNAVKEIRNIDASIPIIAFSTSFLSKEELEGFNDAIAKPVKFGQIKTILNNYIIKG